jgi:G3E family GTPase
VLVGGFLGAGKTSLMRHLIRDAKARGLRVAVIVNEFGVEDVDSNILREGDAELLASVAGGCACCSGQDDLLEALRELATRDASTRPDAILLEASGLADTTLLLEVVTAPDLSESVRVASILGVIDAERATRATAAENPPHNSAQSGGALQKRQLLLADFLLLNKADLVAPRTLENFVAALKALHPRAHIVPCVRADIDAAPLWQRVLQSDASTRTSKNEENNAPQSAKNAASTRAVSDSENAPRHAIFQTLVVPLPHPLPRAALEKLLRELPGEEHEEGVWRAKGFVRLRGESGVHLVQFTGGIGGGRFGIAPFHLRIGDEEPKGALVFIGPALNVETLQGKCDALSLSAAY